MFPIIWFNPPGSTVARAAWGCPAAAYPDALAQEVPLSCLSLPLSKSACCPETETDCCTSQFSRSDVAAACQPLLNQFDALHHRCASGHGIRQRIVRRLVPPQQGDHVQHGPAHLSIGLGLWKWSGWRGDSGCESRQRADRCRKGCERGAGGRHQEGREAPLVLVLPPALAAPGCCWIFIHAPRQRTQQQLMTVATPMLNPKHQALAPA